MNKKKVLALATSLGLIGAIGVGATLAYFTDQQEVTNVITMGNVNITLTEESADGEENDFGGFDYGTEENDPIVPGDDLDKKAFVALEGNSQDAYIRVVATLSLSDYTGTTFTMESLQDVMEAEVNEINAATNVDGSDLNAGDWLMIPGTWSTNTTTNEASAVFYYNQILTDPAVRVQFIDNIEVPTSWGNDAADEKFSIKIEAHAIQADNFTPDFTSTTDPWNGATVEEYVAPAPTPAP